MTETETDPHEPTVAQTADRVKDVRTYLHWGALAGFTLLAIAATLQLYGSATRAIRIWVSPDFQPVFVAAFNLVVLLVAGIGISWILRRLDAGSTDGGSAVNDQ